MRSIKTIVRLALLCAVSMCVCVAQAPPAPPPDATQSPVATPVQPQAPLYQVPEGEQASDQTVRDDRPLSGMLDLTLGTVKSKQNLLSLGFRVGQMFDSNRQVLGRESDYESATSFSGTVHLARTGPHGTLNLDYQGGGFAYSGNLDMNWYPKLDIAQSFVVRRWTLSFADHVEYTPESMQAAGLGLETYAGVLSSGINSALLPNQSIYTPLVARLSNMATGQVQYGLSPRTSWTAAFSYGNLYFPDGQFANDTQIGVRTGYNNELTAKDTVSGFYEYGRFRSSTGHADTHSVQLAYARRLTGRLTWSVSAGPQVSTPLFTSDSARVSWTATTIGQYQRMATAVSFSYSHAVRGGSGVFDRVENDMAELTASRTIFRTWMLVPSGSISRNNQLRGVGEYKSGTASMQVRRRLGEHAGMYFMYAFQRQVAGAPCVGPLCAGLSRQIFGFGFDWEPHTWVLR